MAPTDTTKDAIFATPDETVLTYLGTRACARQAEYRMHQTFPDRSYTAVPGGPNNPDWAFYLTDGYRLLDEEENYVLELIMRDLRWFGDPSWWKTEEEA